MWNRRDQHHYAVSAGLDPVKDPILKEDAKGPYVNLIAVREGDAGKPWVATLVESYRSPEVKAFILDKFKGAVPAVLVSRARHLSSLRRGPAAPERTRVRMDGDADQ